MYYMYVVHVELVLLLQDTTATTKRRAGSQPCWGESRERETEREREELIILTNKLTYIIEIN